VFKKLLFISVLTLLLLPSFAFAVDVPGLPLVPCGTSTTAPCTQCDLFQLLKNVIDFTVGGLMPPLAALLFIWGGLLLLVGGANPGWVAQGKTIFTNTFYGVMVMLAAWMITNTLIKSVGATYDTADTWWQFTCTTDVSGAPPDVSGTPPVDGGACGQSWEQNLCEPRQMTCSASACSQYTSAINKYAGGAASANLLKAIMMKESTCDASAESQAGSYGLMQLQPLTANMYKQNCGVTEDITGIWLKSHPEESICIAAAYIRGLDQSACGGSVRTLAAGYNGGGGACDPSQVCVGETSCDGGSVQRWECLYDDKEPSVCNTGYAETRDYATKVLYCYSNPGF